jgi:hypothetical protein
MPANLIFESNSLVIDDYGIEHNQSVPSQTANNFYVKFKLKRNVSITGIPRQIICDSLLLVNTQCMISLRASNSTSKSINIILNPTQSLVVNNTCLFSTRLTQEDCEYLYRTVNGNDIGLKWTMDGFGIPLNPAVGITVKFTLNQFNQGGEYMISNNNFITKIADPAGLSNRFSCEFSLELPAISSTAPPTIVSLWPELQIMFNDLNSAIEQFRKSSSPTDYDRVLSLIKKSLDKIKAFKNITGLSDELYVQTGRLTNVGATQASNEVINAIFSMMQEIYNIASKSVHRKTLGSGQPFDFQPDLADSEFMLVSALSIAKFFKSKVGIYFPS